MTGINRRGFLCRAAAIAGSALAAPALLADRSSLTKLNIGIIGVGGKGADNLRGVAGENIAALCDIDAKALQVAAGKYPRARQYRDFRKLLEQKDLDAVVISTPDHTHAVAALMAMDLGKHVYCEKPLTHSIEEARRLTLAARQSKVATQMGNGGHSSDGMRALVEWVQAGVVGNIHDVHCWSNRPIWPQGLHRPAETPAVPSHVDWDLWLGPAAERPWNPAYHPFNWRGWWDFGTGALGDMGCHIMDGPYWALDLGQPTFVEAEAGPMTQESPPKWSVVHYVFPKNHQRQTVRLTWYDGGKKPMPSEAGLPSHFGLPKQGSLLVGERGTILIEHGGQPKLVSGAAMRDFVPPEKVLPRSIGHYEEWIAACKGGKAAGSNFDYAGPLTEMVLLGNVALRAGKRIEWDAESMTVTNAPGAQQFVQSHYRKGWELERAGILSKAGS